MSFYDDDNFHVNIFEVTDAKVPRLNHRPVYNMIISIITDDKEAIDLTRIALTKWFTERGLSSKSKGEWMK